MYSHSLLKNFLPPPTPKNLFMFIVYENSSHSVIHFLAPYVSPNLFLFTGYENEAYSVIHFLAPYVSPNLFLFIGYENNAYSVIHFLSPYVSPNLFLFYSQDVELPIGFVTEAKNRIFAFDYHVKIYCCGNSFRIC